MEEVDQTWDHFHCVFAIALEVAKHLNKCTAELLRGVQHDVAAWSQPRRTVVRHLLARGYFTQMGNSLQCVPTYKTYNPRWK